MMGMHTYSEQYTFGHADPAFTLSLIAASIALVLSYASSIIGRSALLPLAAASVCAIACMMPDNNGRRWIAYAMTAVGTMLCLAAAVLVAL